MNPSNDEGKENNRMTRLRRNSLALLLGASLLPMQSHAVEAVYMMQLGSFQTQEEAESYWSEIQSKHKAALGSVNAQVRSVVLPPDDKVAFRTQAGPVQSRDEADRICAQISNAGDECFVMETAMLNLPDVPVPSAAISTAKTVLTTPNPVTVKSAMAEPAPQEAEPETLMEALLGSDEPKLPVASARAEVQETLPALDIPDMPELPAPPQTMSLAQQEAVAATQKAPEVITPAMKNADQSVRQMEAMLNGGEMNMAAAQAPAAMPEPKVTTLDELPDVETTEEVMIDLETPEPAITAPSVPAGITLPAPPPPSIDVKGKSLAAPAPAPQATPVAQAAPEPTAAPAPQVAVPQTPATQFAESPFAPPATSASAMDMSDTLPGGTVTVDEAIPVAPMDRVETVQRPVAASPSTYSAQAIAARGMPSQAIDQKTYWAQISKFQSQQAALGFWDAFRSQNPAFPAVRVRVTQSYMKSKLGSQDVALRVGPFDGPGMVGALCKNLPAAGVSCSVVADLGTSASASNQRGRMPASRYNNRYQASSYRPSAGGYWLQLGAFDTPPQAEAAWADLQEQMPEFLGQLKPEISTPPLSSSNKAKFRLRTGPYMRVSSAADLCGQLKQRGVRCLVVSGN